MNDTNATPGTPTPMRPPPLDSMFIAILNYRDGRIRVGGAFKNEEITTARGRKYFRLATGSGGATCFPQGPSGWVYAQQTYSCMAVKPCTTIAASGAGAR